MKHQYAMDTMKHTEIAESSKSTEFVKSIPAQCTDLTQCVGFQQNSTIWTVLNLDLMERQVSLLAKGCKFTKSIVFTISSESHKFISLVVYTNSSL